MHKLKMIRKLKLKKWFYVKPEIELRNPLSGGLYNLTIGDVDMLITLDTLQKDGTTQWEVNIEQFLDDLGIVYDCSFPSRFKQKSTFFPQMPYDAIHTFHKVTTIEIKKLRRRGNRSNSNITVAQSKALVSLAKDTNIVIRPSDKGVM